VEFREVGFDVDLIVQVAARDESIAKVLREICALDDAARRAALDLVGIQLGRRASADVLQCLEALRGDDLAHRLAARLGPSP
jgi:hypothetical protein